MITIDPAVHPNWHAENGGPKGTRVLSVSREDSGWNPGIIMIEMQVAGIAIDARSGQPIVLLNDSARRRALPVWIGVAEASAISVALEHAKPPRPQTHDLLFSLVRQLGYRVESVAINEVDKSTYLATITLLPDVPKADQTMARFIDARPSDAINLALRASAPIFVSDEIVVENTILIKSEQVTQEEEEFKKFLADLKPSDFQKALAQGPPVAELEEQAGDDSQADTTRESAGGQATGAEAGEGPAPSQGLDARS